MKDKRKLEDASTEVYGTWSLDGTPYVLNAEQADVLRNSLQKPSQNNKDILEIKLGSYNEPFERINDSLLYWNDAEIPEYLKERVVRNLGDIQIDALNKNSLIISPNENSKLYGVVLGGPVSSPLGQWHLFPALATSEENRFIFKGFRERYGQLNPDAYCFNTDKNKGFLDKIKSLV